MEFKRKRRNFVKNCQRSCLFKMGVFCSS
uniref:Uncharacterized protein n=1 Tax=Rhizophora mucronata TaxID=61149 RepID=A0A2P2Q5X7_RHIMU